MSVSDNSIPSSSDGQPTPPPAAPPAPSSSQPPAYPHTPGYPQNPAYAPGPPAPSQAYPGAAPAYGAPPSQPGYPTPAQQQSPYQAYPTSIYPAARPSSGLAITSLICGIAGVVLFWAVVPLIASIVAIITGHMALRQTKANPAIGGRGMAFAGLIMGYIMVGVLAIGIVTSVIGLLFFGAFTLPFLYSS